MEKINLDHTDIMILEADTSEMAEYIMNMAKESFESRYYNLDEKEIEEALYWLKSAANNPYDKDYFRHLFAALVLATETEF